MFFGKASPDRVRALTHLWLGLFAFTLIINIYPYLNMGSPVEEVGQVVMETAHTAICTSHFWATAEKEKPSPPILQTAGIASAGLSASVDHAAVIPPSILRQLIASESQSLLPVDLSSPGLLSIRLYRARGPPAV